MSALIPELLLFSHLFMVWDGAFKSLSMGFSSHAVRSSGIAGVGSTWPGIPAGVKFLGAAGCSLAAGMLGRNPIEHG
jgi:hypothetical protein